MADDNKKFSTEDRAEYLGQGVEWLLKIGYLESPDVQIALTANIYRVSERIEDASLVADTEQQKLLVYLKLSPIPEPRLYNKVFSFIRNIFGMERTGIDDLTQEEVGSLVADMIHQVLPDYELRVIFDHALYLKAKDMSEKLQKIRAETLLMRDKAKAKEKKT
jgi:hypothetical protein